MLYQRFSLWKAPLRTKVYNYLKGKKNIIHCYFLSDLTVHQIYSYQFFQLYNRFLITSCKRSEPEAQQSSMHNLERKAQNTILNYYHSHKNWSRISHTIGIRFVCFFFIFLFGRERGGVDGSPQIVRSIDLLVLSLEVQCCPFLQRFCHSSLLKLVVWIPKNSSPLSESVLMDPFL